jgi:ActR/RegA family two-component response regulator
MAGTKILFVDDEPTIRLTLPLILQREGFDVKSAATVSEAVAFINREQFDVLISDLNIGQPGDGFTVVSVMRRVQPNAVTFILTGYPDFESALQAIRKQVDDYLAKPADIPSLVDTLKRKLQSRPVSHQVPVCRAPQLILNNLDRLLEGWVVSAQEDGQLQKLLLAHEDRIGKFREILAGICAQVMRGPEAILDATVAILAAQHGMARFKHGYRPDLIVAESRLLQQQISQFLQQNLLGIDMSTLIADVMSIADLITNTTEQAIRVFSEEMQAA